MASQSIDFAGFVREARRRLKLCSSADGFNTGIPSAERMLCDLNEFSHHFVLACLMDRQVQAERAWAIPYFVGKEIGGFKFSSYEDVPLRRLQTIFQRKSLHRYHGKMATIFFNGVKRIQDSYDGNAKKIWSGNQPSARIVRRFLEFDGVGPKLATMATNILLRQFKIPMTDRSSIDISADRQVMKYFQSNGLLREGAKKEELIYLAREICPDYPGVLDLLAWEEGRQIRRKSSKAKT